MSNDPKATCNLFLFLTLVDSQQNRGYFSVCQACPPGTEPDGDRSACSNCGGNNASAYGVVCEKCASGKATNSPQRTQCNDISAMTSSSDGESGGGGIQDKTVIFEVLSTSDNILPSVGLDMDIDEDLLASFDTDPDAEKAWLANFIAEMAASLGVDPSEIQISRDATTIRRRAQTTRSTSFTVTFASASGDPTAVLQDLETQLVDASSPLMTSSITQALNVPTEALSYSFACREGMVRGAGDSDCSTCDAGKIPDSGQSICLACQTGSYAAPASTSCTDCIPGEYDHDAKPASPCIACEVGKKAARPRASICEAVK